MELANKINRLSHLIGENATHELNNKISKYLEENPYSSDDKYTTIDNLFIYPKIRQYGLKVEVKKRKMLIFHFISRIFY